MREVYINRIETAVPAHDVHQEFIDYAPSMLENDRQRRLFDRLAKRSQIEHRYSFLSVVDDLSDQPGSFYRKGHFPDTGARMLYYKAHAFPFAKQALDKLRLRERAETITHLIVTSCTGFYAPGLDLEIVQNYHLDPSVERTIIGFMGCYAAISGLKAARHIVRSEPDATVLLVNLELCSIHFQESNDLEQLLSFLIFADGCAATLISSQPSRIQIDGFHSTLLDESRDQITWEIGPSGFDMHLSSRVPNTIGSHILEKLPGVLGGRSPETIRHWAIHPGGSSVLDAVQNVLHLPDESLRPSREVLRQYGNMSSATIMFVLRDLLLEGGPGPGCAVGFGPGMAVESMTFSIAK